MAVEITRDDQSKKRRFRFDTGYALEIIPEKQSRKCMFVILYEDQEIIWGKVHDNAFGVLNWFQGTNGTKNLINAYTDLVSTVKNEPLLLSERYKKLYGLHWYVSTDTAVCDPKLLQDLTAEYVEDKLEVYKYVALKICCPKCDLIFHTCDNVEFCGEIRLCTHVQNESILANFYYRTARNPRPCLEIAHVLKVLFVQSKMLLK